MKNGKYMILVIFLLSLSSQLISSSIDTTSIIDNIYNYDFLKATRRLSGLSEKEPLKYKALNLEVNWWMAMERKDKERFSEFLKSLDQFDKVEPSALSSVISSTYRIRYYACTNRKYMIPVLFLQVQKQIEIAESTVLQSSFTEEKELFILYKSFLGLVQNSYSINGFFAGYEINNELIESIESLIRNGSYSNRTIGRYFLMKYYLDIEKDKSKALTYLTELHNQYPKNLIFSQLLTNK
jgi:hypothetical protein